MLDILGSVISVVSAANNIHDAYQNIGTLIRGRSRSDEYLEKLSEEMGGIRVAVENLSETIRYTPSLAGITDPTQSRQRCVNTLREARQLLEPIQRETGDVLLSSSLIWTPQRFKSAMGKDPWEVLDPIHPLNRTRVLDNPDKLPVLFLDNGVYYIGWTMRGALPGMFGCEVHDKWVYLGEDLLLSSSQVEKDIRSQTPLDAAKLFYRNRSANFLSALSVLALEICKAIPENIQIENAQQEFPLINKMIGELKVVLGEGNKSEGRIPRSKVQVLCGTTNAMITIRHKDGSLTRYKITYLPHTNISFNSFTKLSHALFLLGYQFDDNRGSNYLDQPEYTKLGLNFNVFHEIEKCVTYQLDQTLERLKNKLLSYPDDILLQLYHLNENTIFENCNEIVAFEEARCRKLFNEA